MIFYKLYNNSDNNKESMALRNLKGIKELRFILRQSSPASEGLRYDPIND